MIWLQVLDAVDLLEIKHALPEKKLLEWVNWWSLVHLCFKFISNCKDVSGMQSASVIHSNLILRSFTHRRQIKIINDWSLFTLIPTSELEYLWWIEDQGNFIVHCRLRRRHPTLFDWPCLYADVLELLDEYRWENRILDRDEEKCLKNSEKLRNPNQFYVSHRYEVLWIPSGIDMYDFFGAKTITSC